MLQTVLFRDAIKKAVMHKRYLVKVNALKIRPQVHIDNLLVFICGSLFVDSDFCQKYNMQYKKPVIIVKPI